MNFEAWQGQQKALKGEERKRKSQAAEALRNYRGGGLSEEETKLAAIREQERKQKEEAERGLREYRGTLSEEDKKLAALREEERRKKLEAEQKLRGFGLASNSQDDPSQMISPGAVSAMAGKFSGEAAGQGTTESMTGTPSVDSNPQGGFAAPADAAVDNLHAHAQPATQAPIQQTINLATVSPLKLDASFVFGIISAEENSTLDGYLAAIDRIVKSVIGDEIMQASTFEYPSVKSIERDASFMDPAGRAEVTRRMVNISIPFLASDAIAGADAKMKVIGAVRSAIQNGSFQKHF